MSGNIEYIIYSPHDPDVTILIAAGAVASKVVLLASKVVRVIALLETLRITPDGADHRRPWFLEHQNTAVALWNRLARFVDNIGHDAR